MVDRNVKTELTSNKSEQSGAEKGRNRRAWAGKSLQPHLKGRAMGEEVKRGMMTWGSVLVFKRWSFNCSPKAGTSWGKRDEFLWGGSGGTQEERSPVHKDRSSSLLLLLILPILPLPQSLKNLPRFWLPAPKRANVFSELGHQTPKGKRSIIPAASFSFSHLFVAPPFISKKKAPKNLSLHNFIIHPGLGQGNCSFVCSLAYSTNKKPKQPFKHHPLLILPSRLSCTRAALT